MTLLVCFVAISLPWWVAPHTLYFLFAGGRHFDACFFRGAGIKKCNTSLIRDVEQVDPAGSADRKGLPVRAKL